ncbi:MAG: serine hydrolase [Planctomycetota bacterium]
MTVIEKGNIPGAVVLVGQRDKVLYWKAFGHEVNEPFEEVMNKDAIFDMASLTKPVATTTQVNISLLLRAMAKKKSGFSIY